MKKRNLLAVSVVAVCTAATLVSCSSDEDVFNSSSLDEIHKKEYAENFVAKYGQIPANKSWDFTTGEVQLTRGFKEIRTEIMEQGINFGDLSNLKVTVKNAGWLHSEFQGAIDASKPSVEKNEELLTAITTVLPEKKQWTGKPAVLVAPSSGFYIYPLFCGGRLTFDLKVKVGDQEPVTVFQKDWINFQIINGMKKDTRVADGGIVNMKGIYIEAPVGTPIEVYLDNITDKNEGKNFPKVAGTTNGYAVYVDIPEGIKPELEGVELKEDAIVKYIGIEDVVTGAPESSDRDYNDVVLAVVGNPDVPEEVIITEDKYEVNTNRTKRYMIEDLGATDDFDFNDVVVDVTQYITTTHTVTKENGVLKSDVVSGTTINPTSKATIRCMGGTMDFELTVGESTWVKSEKGFDVATMYNTQGSIDYDKALAEFDVTGYDYDANNISVKANNKNGQVFIVTFPKKGTAPMIIAVDPTQNWMKERSSVPGSWFY